MLRENNLLRTTKQVGATRFCVTDTPERFQRVGGAFFGAELAEVAQVELDHIDNHIKGAE
jgi:hypothetical protein